MFIAAGLHKSYAGTQALAGVDFDVAAGEVHALVGENGAGKSTLARIVAGLVRPDSGRMQLRGGEFAPAGRRQAQRYGVRIVTQELNQVGTFTLAESIFIDRIPHRFGVIDRVRLNRQAAPHLARVGLENIDPARHVETLGVGQRQLVEIAAALSQPCALLVLDEPTASLTEAESNLLFDRIAELKATGAGILYISHRLDEVGRIADRITVLRDGRRVETGSAGVWSRAEIVALMVGSARLQQPPSARPKAGALVVRARRLRRAGVVRDVSLDLHAGEVVGLAGLVGSGRTETVRLLFGADRLDGGEIFLDGATTPVRMRSPRDAVQAGIGLLVEDRQQQSLLLPLSVRVNCTLAKVQGSSRFGWLRTTREREVARQLTAALHVVCSSVDQPVGQLSGGNQQKVALAKWLYRDCRVLICDEPTRGVDVQARLEIHRLLQQSAENGKAVLVVSSELEELLDLCDRIVVLSDGRVADVIERPEFSRQRIITAALSGYTASVPVEAKP
ncbi:MAG: sugar ABC transporter ATP-binding protein [Acidobacteriota bacterium]